MSDQELLKNHIESGDEMLKRNMVGAEIWKTADGVITNGSREARMASDPHAIFLQLGSFNPHSNIRLRFQMSLTGRIDCVERPDRGDFADGKFDKGEILDSCRWRV